MHSVVKFIGEEIARADKAIRRHCEGIAEGQSLVESHTKELALSKQRLVDLKAAREKIKHDS